jgi:hypothetical protein
MDYKYVKILTIFFCEVLVVLFLSCSSNNNPLAGSISQTGNGIVTGTVISTRDVARNGVVVTLRLHDYNPGASSTSDSIFLRTTVTDANGLFKFDSIPADTYTIEGTSSATGQKLLHFNVIINKQETTILNPDTLKSLGSIRLYLPDTLRNSIVYVYIPGTSFGRAIDVKETSLNYIDIDSIPECQLPGIYYIVKNSLSQLRHIRESIAVVAGETVPIAFLDWTHQQKIHLNTSVTGANVTKTITNFPVLIRLNAATFNFDQAKSHGEDVRFTNSDGVVLPYEIEYWDAVAKRAAIWVKVDTLRGNDSLQSIMLYWGNPLSTDMSNSTAVFDTSNGFQGVWHLSDKDTNPAGDATVNGYIGTSPDSARPQIAEGVIGNCRSFNGVSQYITMPNTAESKLNFPQNGNYSVSVWVKADTLTDLQQSLVSKGRYQYFLWIDSTFWQFWEYQDRKGWEATLQPATPNQWVLLTGIRDGASQYLYVNGERVDSVSLKTDFNLRNTTNDLILGRVHDLGIIPVTATGQCSFRGKLDEVRIVSTAHSSEWVRLCYMNQRVDDRLVIFIPTNLTP